jgi:hypothetical protein
VRAILRWTIAKNPSYCQAKRRSGLLDVVHSGAVYSPMTIYMMVHMRMGL